MRIFKEIFLPAYKASPFYNGDGINHYKGCGHSYGLSNGKGYGNGHGYGFSLGNGNGAYPLYLIQYWS